MAEGIVAALIDGVPGEVYNIGSGIGLTNRQVLDTIRPLADQTGYEVKLNILPPRPFDVPVNILDTKKLYELTRWSPINSFAEAVAKTWSWYIQR